jgi:SRSO17 transposase
MAAGLDRDNVQPMRQGLHHLVAKAPWNDAALLEQVRHYVLPRMQKQRSVAAWIAEDAGFPKTGKHSGGVTRQYCGQVGKQENCPCGGEFVGGEVEFESADQLPLVSEEGMG